MLGEDAFLIELDAWFGGIVGRCMRCEREEDVELGQSGCF